eukprot:XP_014778063.1 PREDICTED: uncharacterized protein LOC106874740 isoform X2 [Octopus bimaculoides]
MKYIFCLSFFIVGVATKITCRSTVMCPHVWAKYPRLNPDKNYCRRLNFLKNCTLNAYPGCYHIYFNRYQEIHLTVTLRPTLRLCTT